MLTRPLFAMRPTRANAVPPWGDLRRNQRGTALVEMAMAGPLFFLLLFAVAEFGRAIWLYDSVSHGAREAARFAIVRGAESGRATNADAVRSYVRNISGLDEANVTTVWQPNNQPGSVVQVTVEVPFNPLVPFFPPFPVSSTSRLVISF